MNNHSNLRLRIIEVLVGTEEIVSVFSFMVEEGYVNYTHALASFHELEREGVIIMTKNTGRGNPWHVTKGRNFPCQTIPVSGSVASSVVSLPLPVDW